MQSAFYSLGCILLCLGLSQSGCIRYEGPITGQDGFRQPEPVAEAIEKAIGPESLAMTMPTAIGYYAGITGGVPTCLEEIHSAYRQAGLSERFLDTITRIEKTIGPDGNPRLTIHYDEGSRIHVNISPDSAEGADCGDKDSPDAE